MCQIDVDHIIQYGIEEAFLIDYLQTNIHYHRSRDEYFYDGHYWTYCSTKYLIDKMFPFLNDRKFNYIVKSLVKQGVILVGNYNKNKFDKTRWFAFVDEEKFLGSP